MKTQQERGIGVVAVVNGERMTWKTVVKWKEFEAGKYN
jgi:hypothetical protein